MAAADSTRLIHIKEKEESVRQVDIRADVPLNHFCMHGKAGKFENFTSGGRTF